MTKAKIMFVCTGNICRSPLAEALFRKRAAERGVEAQFDVDSSGLVTDHIGERSDPRMRQTAARHGVEIDHRAKRFDEKSADRYDLIVVMDRGHLRRLRRVLPAPLAKKHVVLFRDYDPDAQGPADVPDPWYGGPEGFEHVFELIERTIDPLIDAALAEREA